MANRRMVDRFFSFMMERHEIYLNRVAGHMWPWTQDKILQTYRFTNVYRELDKTTKWFAANARLQGSQQRTVFAALAFRQFNTIRIGEAFNAEGLYHQWDRAKAARILRRLGPPYVTGAYIINSPNGVPKHVGCLNMISRAWARRERLTGLILADLTLENAVGVLTSLPNIGGFMAYEVACDLRWTPVLSRARDVRTWAHTGPGALRGLKRLEGATGAKSRALGARGRLRGTTLSAKPLYLMRVLLEQFTPRWPWKPALELREIEHSLCEFDKYERVRLGEGRPRQLFRHEDR